MRRFSLPLAVALLTAAAMIVPVGHASAADETGPSLWITDDVTKMTYNVTLDGVLITWFETPRTAKSSIAVDPWDGTLWGANEGTASGELPGKLVNYTRSGEFIQEIDADLFGALGTEGVALAISPENDTLWVVDDPPIDGPAATVYHVARDGELLSWFVVADFDREAGSPQGIAYDEFNSSLWITDNSTDKVYNVTLDGDLLSSFPTDAGPFITDEDPSGIENPQGVTVESPDILWITGRDTGTIYRVTKTGDNVLNSIPIGQFDDSAANPTGVAFDGIGAIDLGAASEFAVLGLPGAKLQMKDVGQWSGVVGDVGLGPGAQQDFAEGLLTGTYVVDPEGDNRHNNHVVISGGTVEADLSPAVADALHASTTAASLSPDQVFGDIKGGTTITGGPGLNVIEANKIELDKGKTLTISGGPASIFVFNVYKRFKLREASSIGLSGGVVAENVLFNILGDDDSAIEGGSVASGRILAPFAKMKIRDKGSLLIGAIIGGSEIKLEAGGRLRVFSAALPPGSVGQAANAAMVALPGSKLKLHDTSSTVFGDVLLGPLAKQEFDQGTIDGNYRVDPAADDSHNHNVTITGLTMRGPESRPVADAIDASMTAASLSPDRVYADIKGDTTITGGPGLTVIEAKKIELDHGKILTLFGSSSSTFVFNLHEKLHLKEASSIVLRGVDGAENVGFHVLFNVLGDKDSAIESGSTMQGTILAPDAGRVKVKDAGSTLFGAVIGGHETIIEKGGTVAALGGSAVFVGAGDIADCGSNAAGATAQLLDSIPGTVFTLGDNAYPDGATDEYNNCYEPTWGHHKARTHPALGDNDYNTGTASPSFDYFGAALGDPNKGYYSYDVGAWHIITLNSNCSEIGGCGLDSDQGRWLQADLAAHPTACILAIHHQPLFSSGGGSTAVQDFWEPLYAAGADIVLSGHRHTYERFAQQDPSGVADPGRGIRQFVVGTGGASLHSFDSEAPNSEVRNDTTHGVLKLTLHPTSYDWEFVPIAGETFTDSGSTNCVTPP
jgi:choice-of-anchor A domain-containing protein